MALRKFFLLAHLVGGLLAALPLIALGLSGALLVFEGEIQRSLNWRLYEVHPQGLPKALHELGILTEQRHSGFKLAGINIPVENGVAWSVHLRASGKGTPVRVTVDPYTGEELGSLDSATQFLAKAHQFHTNLLLGPPGKQITATAAGLLTALTLSGLILWWPRKIRTVSFGSGGGRTNSELHHALGFYASFFLLILALTGLGVHWDDDLRQWINHKAGVMDDAPIPTNKPGAGPRLNASELQARANQSVPEAQVTSLQNLGGNGPVRITMRYPEDRTPAGRTNLYLDGVTGEILFRQTSRSGPIGMRIAKLWNREFHTGDIAGWPTRILACVASLALPLLAITGPLMWFGKLRRKAKAARAAERQLT